MLAKTLAACSLLAVTVVIHAVGLTALWRSVMSSPMLADTRFWPGTRLLIRVAVWTLLLHFLEIAVWALFYSWQKCLPDFESSLYFAAVTYTTVGYGDLVLPKEWRLLAGVEALTGILMCGWSTAFFVATVGRLYKPRMVRDASSHAEDDVPTPAERTDKLHV